MSVCRTSRITSWLLLLLWMMTTSTWTWSARLSASSTSVSSPRRTAEIANSSSSRPATTRNTTEAKCVHAAPSATCRRRSGVAVRVHGFQEDPQGRLNHWAHWARAHGSRIFSSFRGPPTGCGEINFSKLIFLSLMLLHDRTNTSSAYLVNLGPNCFRSTK